MQRASDDLASSGNEWAANLQLENLPFELEFDQPAPPPTYSTPQPRLGAAIVPHQQLTSERSFPFPVKMTNEGLQYGQSSSYESASAAAAADLDDDNDLDVGDTRQGSSPPRDLHRRGYQACDPCRKRKVKCDLGSVDNPHDPPCSRCRREHKDCVFSATRRKRKQSRDADDASDDGGLGRDKRRLMLSTEDSQDEGIAYTNPYTSTSPYPQSANSAPQWPLHPNQTRYALQTTTPSNGYDLSMMAVSTDRRSSKTLSPRPLTSITSPRTNPGNANEHMLNKEAANILGPAIATSHQALHLLSVAAGQTEEANRQNSQSLPSHLRSPTTTFGTPSSGGTSHRRTASHNMTSGEKLSGEAARFGTTMDQAFDPAEDKSYQDAVHMWSRMRLVKDGWFTETEAIAYVDYYYQHLAPMTPVVINDYRPLSMHTSLVIDEPILAITILTIASRHMRLTGPGATTRAYHIHNQLWANLQGMVQRLVWGQEQFGGGFCGGGAIKTHESRTGQITWKGSLRTLGTIEALLLLTDWHPRALHFPPGDNENRLVDADFPLGKGHEDLQADSMDTNDDGKVAFSSWLEPAWRSDRMSWMLLGAAVTLSFELGVFDKEHYNCKEHHGPESECARKQRVRRMVLVYVSQTSGRLGFAPMLSFEHWKTDPVFESTRGYRAGPVDAVEAMQECWMGIAGLMYKANEEIFLSNQYTRDLTSSGQYIAAIARFKPMLQQWKSNFDRVRSQLDPVMQHLLSMEYDYARLYINSLGLQKVVESWLNISNEAATSDHNVSNASHGVGIASAGSGGVTFSLLLDIWRPNKEYIDEVSDAARSILKTVLEGLVPDGNLSHASVRSYFRILSGLMFTLKRFSFGASEQGVRESLTLLDSITDQLTRSVVDDVHLSARTAELVKMLSSHLRAKFIRLQAPTGGSTGSSRENSRHHTPQRQQEQHPSSQQHFTSQQGPQLSRSAFNNQFPYSQDLPQLHDPLAGIQAQSMSDLVDVTYMPPMNYNAYLDGSQGVEQSPADFGQGVVDGGDWFALPLNKFFATDPAPVHQGFGGIGPTVGSKDMLEFITDEQYDRWDGVNNFGRSGNGYNQG